MTIPPLGPDAHSAAIHWRASQVDPVGEYPPTVDGNATRHAHAVILADAFLALLDWIDKQPEQDELRREAVSLRNEIATANLKVLDYQSGARKSAERWTELANATGLRGRMFVDFGYQQVLAASEDAFRRLALWKWLTDMCCTVHQAAVPPGESPKWFVADVDGDVLGDGETPEHAIAAAKNHIDSLDITST